MTTSAPLTGKFESIVGAGNVCPAAAKDAIAGVQPQYEVSPGNEQELASVLASANEAGLAVIPRGGGTKLQWGNPPKRADVVVSTLRLNRILEHAWADLTVAVEAGCTIKALQDALAQHGQRLALDALWPERATIGGVLSSNDSGVLRLRYGALRDLIIGVTLALPDGTLATSGGKVVKNVAGYDLPKLATGAFGTLGVITRAVFRLHPLCPSVLTLAFKTASIEAMQESVLSIQNSQLANTALQIRYEPGREPEADILFEATPAGLAAQRAKLQEIVSAAKIIETSEDVWLSKQRLWDSAGPHTAVAKISVLPSAIAATICELEKTTKNVCEWQIVIQATGIGWVRINDPSNTSKTGSCLSKFRLYLQKNGGSLVLLWVPPEINPPDAWGEPGDAIGVMRALKERLDPKSTLNPGRFVGGI